MQPLVSGFSMCTSVGRPHPLQPCICAGSGRSGWLFAPLHHDRTHRFQDVHFTLNDVDVLYCHLCGTLDGFG